MDSFVRRARRGGVVIAALVCIVSSLAAIRFALRPETLAQTETPELLTLAALVILPGAGVGGWALERRARG